MLDAFHLPALSHLQTTVWPYGKGASAVELRMPQLTPAVLAEQLDALLEARDAHLADRPVAEIVSVIDTVAERLLDPADELRRTAEAALPAVTGASLPMVRRILDEGASDWRRPRLRELLRAEFGDPALLDAFRPRSHASGLTRVYGPRLVSHVFGGHVPGIEASSIVRSLLVKAAVLGRTAAGEPVLGPLFARGIAEVDAGLGACIAVSYWPAGDVALERIALDSADVVVAYGSQELVDSVRERAPRASRFHGYPQRMSLGVISREALTTAHAGDLAARAALDVALFDQHRYHSPHVFYVEVDGEVSPADWSELLANRLQQLNHELPRGSVTPGEASAIRQLRSEAETAQRAGQGVVLHASRDSTAWTVIYDPDPAFIPSCRNRVIRVKPVPDLGTVLTVLRPIAPTLLTVGLEGSSERHQALAGALGRLGVSRIAPIGRMACPPTTWHQDGHPTLGSLVRWCDYESPGDGEP